MENLTSLESAALTAIAYEVTGHRADLIKSAIDRASVISRENTGGGFFSDLRMDTSKFPKEAYYLGQNVWIAVAGLHYGLGMILHIKGEHTVLLEGYAVGPEDTLQIAFDAVCFAIIPEPGSLP